MNLKPAIALLGLLFSLTVIAQAAPWYLWQSKANGATFCAQTAPGGGWERVAGPFRDAGCRKPG